MGRQKQSGLWIMGYGIMGCGQCLEGWSKQVPRVQDEAAAVVRLVWQAGRRVVRVVCFAHGPLEDIAESEAESHGRAGPGRRLGGSKARFGCPRSQSGRSGWAV